MDTNVTGPRNITPTAAGRTVATNSGALIWWDFDDVKVTRADAERVIAKHGMTDKLKIPDYGEETNIRKAASEFSFGRGTDARWKAEVVGVYDDGTIEIALLQHTRLSKDKAAVKKVEWTHVESVVYTTNTSAWLYSGKTEAAARFIELANRKLEFLGSEFVRRFLLARPLWRAGCFPLRQRVGGFFFAPLSVAPFAETLANIVNDLPTNASVSVAYIDASAASQGSIGKAASDYLAGEITNLKGRMEAWKASARAPRQDAVATTMEEFANLRNLAELYRDALGLQVSDLEADLDALRASATELVSANEAGVIPGLVPLIRGLAVQHAGVEISYAALETAGFPTMATGARAKTWWTGRGATNAKEAGIAVVATDAGVTFTEIGAAPAEPASPVAVVAPEIAEAFGLDAAPNVVVEPVAAEETPAAPPTVVESDEGDARAIAEAMTVPQLQKALKALGQKFPPNAKKSALLAQYIEAVGI